MGRVAWKKHARKARERRWKARAGEPNPALADYRWLSEREQPKPSGSVSKYQQQKYEAVLPRGTESEEAA